MIDKIFADINNFMYKKEAKKYVKDLLKSGVKLIDGSDIVWYEPEEFYAEFEKVINDNIKDADNKEEIFKDLQTQTGMFDFQKFSVSDKCYHLIREGNFKPTMPILEREYYIGFYATYAALIGKVEQLQSVGKELETLILEN